MTLLGEMKITRDAHLIVLDNTETMARNDADIQALSSQINELSRRARHSDVPTPRAD